MNKKSLIIISSIIAVAVSIIILTLAVMKNNAQMVIQGEVDTKTVDLSSKITGRIKQIHVKKGDMVKAGDVLITLDTPDIFAKSQQSTAALEAAEAQKLAIDNGARQEQKEMALSSLNQAQADFELAQKTYTRMKKLNEEGVIAAQKLDEISTRYKTAQKTVEAARANLQMYVTGSRYEEKILAGANVRKAQGVVQEVNSYLQENQIKTPISGQITDIAVEEGELVGAGYTIITIVDINDNWVVFNLREDLLSKIKMGSEFDVTIPAVGKEPVKVKVDYISVLGNFATWRATKVRGDFDLKTFEIHARPVTPPEGLRAGMSAIADWNKVGKN
ncbi:MAG: efflux RND transporter periplasmic adaptor subunit [Candidatus Gastranaerophilales bacterium]|nr:efflux RND transporter periplasmic adaptor subunit [Candidatus Gastranaerophilales bacterium]